MVFVLGTVVVSAAEVVTRLEDARLELSFNRLELKCRTVVRMTEMKTPNLETWTN